MDWKHAAEAGQAWAGGLNAKFLYTAVRRGELKCARYGAGRNMLFCEQWVTDWLLASAERGRVLRKSAVTALTPTLPATHVSPVTAGTVPGSIKVPEGGAQQRDHQRQYEYDHTTSVRAAAPSSTRSLVGRRRARG